MLSVASYYLFKSQERFLLPGIRKTNRVIIIKSIKLANGYLLNKYYITRTLCRIYTPTLRIVKPVNTIISVNFYIPSIPVWRITDGGSTVVGF